MAEDLVPIKPLDQARLVLLAREVATDLRDLAAILADFNLSQEEYDRLLQNPYYKNALETSIIEWNSAHTTDQRIKIRAAAAIEDALMPMAVRMTKEGEPLTAVVETGKLFAKLAGLGEEGRSANPAEKFSITINLGEDKKLTFEKDVTPTPALIEKDQTNEHS